MANSFFQFKQFTVHQDRCAMKVTTDGCLFGAWVATQIADSKPGSKKILDIGTGTGLLALMTMQKNTASIDAVEIDRNSFDQARENILSSPWSDNITIFNRDIKEFNPVKKYDFIICNPPFYENELQSPASEKNIAHHSTMLTLENLLGIIKALLADSGSFFLLLPYKRNDEIAELLKGNELKISKKVLVRQTINHDFFRIMIKGENKNVETEETEISIRGKDQEYTREFTSLLKAYYLHL